MNPGDLEMQRFDNWKKNNSRKLNAKTIREQQRDGINFRGSSCIHVALNWRLKRVTSYKEFSLIQWNISNKKPWILTICNSMGGLRGYYAQWNKPDTERQMPLWFYLHVESTEWYELTNKMKTDCGWEIEWKGSRDWEVQIDSYNTVAGS